MKRLAALVGALVALTIIGGCGGGGGGAVGAVGAGPAAVGRVIGTILDAAGQPVQGAVVQIRGTNLTVTSQQDGLFDIQNVPIGSQIIDVTSSQVTVSKPVTVTQNLTTNAGIVSVTAGGGGAGGGGAGGGGGVSPNAPPPPPF